MLLEPVYPRVEYAPGHTMCEEREAWLRFQMQTQSEVGDGETGGDSAHRGAVARDRMMGLQGRAAHETMMVYPNPSEGHDEFLDAHGAGDGGVGELHGTAAVGVDEAKVRWMRGKGGMSKVRGACTTSTTNLRPRGLSVFF